MSSLLGLPASAAAVVALHLGKLHPYEHVLVYLLAFGPFLLLGITIAVSRRRAAAEEEPEPGSDGSNGADRADRADTG